MYLSAYLSEYCKDTNLNKVIINLSNAAIQISKIIRNLNNDINNRGESDTKNFDGDVQKPLDILSVSFTFVSIISVLNNSLICC